MSCTIKRLPSTGDLPELQTLLWFGKTQPIFSGGQYFAALDDTGAPEVMG